MISLEHSTVVIGVSSSSSSTLFILFLEKKVQSYLVCSTINNEASIYYAAGFNGSGRQLNHWISLRCGARLLCLLWQPLWQPWARAAHSYCSAWVDSASHRSWDGKWVPAFGLSNPNKWWRWMWIVAAYWWTYRPSHLAWFECWQSSGTQSVFIKWTGWTLTMA